MTKEEVREKIEPHLRIGLDNLGKVCNFGNSPSVVEGLIDYIILIHPHKIMKLPEEKYQSLIKKEPYRTYPNLKFFVEARITPEEIMSTTDNLDKLKETKTELAKKEMFGEIIKMLEDAYELPLEQIETN